MLSVKEIKLGKNYHRQCPSKGLAYYFEPDTLSIRGRLSLNFVIFYIDFLVMISFLAM